MQCATATLNLQVGHKERWVPKMKAQDVKQNLDDHHNKVKNKVNVQFDDN